MRHDRHHSITTADFADPLQSWILVRIHGRPLCRDLSVSDWSDPIAVISVARFCMIWSVASVERQPKSIRNRAKSWFSTRHFVTFLLTVHVSLLPGEAERFLCIVCSWPWFPTDPQQWLLQSSAVTTPEVLSYVALTKHLKPFQNSDWMSKMAFGIIQRFDVLRDTLHHRFRLCRLDFDILHLLEQVLQ